MIRALLLSCLFAVPCIGQTRPGSASTSGPCSPAISGNNNNVTLENCTPEKRTTDLIESVRPAVVQVYVRITDVPLPTKPVPDCFAATRRTCVVGTGFFMNDAGDVVTASHVANAAQQIIQTLGSNGIHAEVGIGVNMPNVETKILTFGSNTEGFTAILIATDAEHDIAALHTPINPFTNMPKTFGGTGTENLPQTRATFVHLAVERPRDGEEIVACGFPFGESGLVTTSGTIASAWKTESLLSAKAATTFPRDVDVYWADLRINAGNSGGPVFRVTDSAVLGMAVELKGSLGVVVPAKYIVDFLKSHNIHVPAIAPQTSAPPTPSRLPGGTGSR